MTVKSVCEILTNVIETFGSDPDLSFDHEQLARSVESFILQSRSWEGGTQPAILAMKQGLRKTIIAWRFVQSLLAFKDGSIPGSIIQTRRVSSCYCHGRNGNVSTMLQAPLQVVPLWY